MFVVVIDEMIYMKILLFDCIRKVKVFGERNNEVLFLEFNSKKFFDDEL